MDLTSNLVDLPDEVLGKIMAVNYTSSFKLSCVNRFSMYEHKMSQLKQFYENFKPYMKINLYLKLNREINFDNFLNSQEIVIIVEEEVNFDFPYDFTLMKNLDYFKFMNLNVLRFKLKSIPLFSNTVKTLIFIGCNIKQINNLPSNLSHLNLSNNNISNIENLPNSIVNLDLSHNNIKYLKNLPQLKRLVIYDNKISVIENLPVTLYALCIYDNPIIINSPLVFWFRKLPNQITNSHIHISISSPFNEIFSIERNKMYTTIINETSDTHLKFIS